MLSYDTPAGALRVERAVASDLESVALLLEEVSHWLIAIDRRMWREQFDREPIAEAIQREEVYLGLLADELVGTFRLDWEPGEEWESYAGSAGYMHKLVIRRKYAGNRLGRYLLQAAADLARGSGRRLLRLDCLAGNEVLRGYYESNGFNLIEVVQKGEWTLCLYELPLDA